MSYKYDEYLKNHRANVQKGLDWLKENLPDLIEDNNVDKYVGPEHDLSKDQPDEYEAYDKYFYGGNKSYQVVEDFREAWLKHIHRNPHHWQYWVLINDDPNEGEICIEMPGTYVVEMICDWWAFSWAKGDLFEIFKWYEERKNYIKLHDRTRIFVESTLDSIKYKLKEKRDE